MRNSLPVIPAVVWSSTSEFEWLGLHWVQSWFCGVVETVTTMIEAIRKMPFLQPSLLALHISLFCRLHTDWLIYTWLYRCWAEMEGKERAPPAWTIIPLSISVSFAFCHRIAWGSEHEIFWSKQAKEAIATRTAWKALALHRGWSRASVLPIRADSSSPLHLEAQGVGIADRYVTCRSPGWRGW